jgi:GNAT superfamily N-acetyltransferase
MSPLSHTPQLALARRADLDELAALRHAEGWIANRWLLHLLGDWPRAAVFTLREHATGPILGTISATAYGGPSVIGNVIVRTEARGRGYGKLLMAAALDWIKERGARTVTLDATTAGQPLYRRFGFLPMHHTWEVWHPLAALDLGAALESASADPDWPLTPLTPETVGSVATLDREAFGGDRRDLLTAMLALPEVEGIAARDADTGAVAGYLLTRPLEPPRAGIYAGPLVARTPEAARALLLAALRRAQAAALSTDSMDGEAAYLALGIPGDSDSPAVRLARALGLALHRDDLRMRLDLTTGAAPDVPDVPDVPGAAAAPDDGQPAWLYGMLSAMVG